MSNKEKADEFLRVTSTGLHQHEETLRKLARRYKYKDQDGLADILQDALLKCYETIKTKGFKGNKYHNYLAVSVYHAFLAASIAYQKQRRGRTLVAEEHNGEQFYTTCAKDYETAEWEAYYQLVGGEEEASTHDAAKFLQAFNMLPEKYQEVLNIRVDKLRYREACRVLNLTPSCLKLRIKTARELLLKNYRLLLNGS